MNHNNKTSNLACYSKNMARSYIFTLIFIGLFFAQPSFAVIEITIVKGATFLDSIEKEPINIGLYADAISKEFILSHSATRIEDIIDYIPSVQTYRLGAVLAQMYQLEAFLLVDVFYLMVF